MYLIPILTYLLPFSEDLNKLYSMWQNRNALPNIPISINVLNTFKQHSRLIHFCHTPLLFLPSWRLQSAATRDRSLISHAISLKYKHQYVSTVIAADKVKPNRTKRYDKVASRIMLFNVI